jgi:hypothetical protein
MMTSYAYSGGASVEVGRVMRRVVCHAAGLFFRPDSVSTGINKKPLSTTQGDGPTTGEEVQIAVIFAKPIVLPAGHYYFRPEVLVNGGDFFYLSTPKPIAAPAIAIAGDLQAWIRNTNLAPD